MITVIVIAAVVVIGGIGALVIGPKLMEKMRGPQNGQRRTLAEIRRNGQDIVAFGKQTIIIMNPTEKDWGYTTVTVNSNYIAHCPEIPKGTQFEIFFKQLLAPNGAKFDSKSEKVQTVRIEPDGMKPMDWTPPLRE